VNTRNAAKIFRERTGYQCPFPCEIKGDKKMDDKTRTEIMKMAVELYDRKHNTPEIQEAIKQLFTNKSTSQINFIVTSAIDMVKSFDKAVDDAGGSGWQIEELLKMTFMDLLSSLATNHVRFVFERPEENA